MPRFEIRHRATAPRHVLLFPALAALTAIGASCGGGEPGGPGGGPAGTPEPQDTSHSPFDPTVPENGTTCAPYPAAKATNGTKTYYRYRPTSGSISWMNSKTACEQVGGKLAVPTTSSENGTILGLNSGKELWIGLFQPWNQTSVGANWQTVDGAALGSFHPWGSGQPNDSDGTENNGQNCTYMFHGTGTDNGKWNDWPCYQNWDFDYVCEFSSAPGTCSTTSCQLATGASTYSCTTCSLAANTTATTTVNANGCPVLTRNTSGCSSSRTGLSGYWLKFSCNVTLSVSNGVVTATAHGQPDYKSSYYPTTDACYEIWSGDNAHNPYDLSSQNYTLYFPSSTPAAPTGSGTSMSNHSVVGLAVNGVPIYGNFAAPGDDIYFEAVSFDRCQGHPESAGQYHYHAEPNVITNDDANFVGVMRDGYPIYGRKDADGTYPTLDSFGGHSGTTPDSTTSVYHYHVNQQTSTNSGTLGQTQWFLTTGTWAGSPGVCTSGCNDP
jgi:hypothetical protein